MATERKAGKGGHVVYDASGRPITIESSEVKALRQAVEIGGRVRFVEWGQPIGIETPAAPRTEAEYEV